MKVSEVIAQLQKLQDENGDKQFHVYLSFSEKTVESYDIFYDDHVEDICIGVYG